MGVDNRNPCNVEPTSADWNTAGGLPPQGGGRRIVVDSSDRLRIHDSCLHRGSRAARHASYDVSKSCADLISLAYHHTYGTPVCVTRCGNLFGGGDLNFNRLVPGTVRSALRAERPIIRSDGTMIRDYVYVKDVAEAYLLLAEKMEDSSGGRPSTSTPAALSWLSSRYDLRARGRRSSSVIMKRRGRDPRQVLSPSGAPASRLAALARSGRAAG